MPKSGFVQHALVIVFLANLKLCRLPERAVKCAISAKNTSSITSPECLSHPAGYVIDKWMPFYLQFPPGKGEEYGFQTPRHIHNIDHSLKLFWHL